MKKPTQDTLTKLLNKKIILGVLAMLIAIVFIAISSFVPFIITKEKLGTAKFWTDELIIVAITIFATIATLFIGQAGNAQKEMSEIAKAKVEFKNSKDLLKNKFTQFSQWVKRVLQPQDIQAIKERELRKVGITDYVVLLLDDEEVIQLNSISISKVFPGEDKPHYFSKLNEKQVKKVLDLKDGVKRIHLVEPQYYLTAKSLGSDKTISEQSGNENTKKTYNLSLSLISKIILTLMFAVIIAALAKDMSEGAGDDAAQLWVTFISRMFALISSSFLGYSVGCQSNDIEAEYIRLRVTVHTLYLEDKTFVPEDEQELAKQEFLKDHPTESVGN